MPLWFGVGFLPIDLFAPTGTPTASKYLWPVAPAARTSGVTQTALHRLTIVWHAVGSLVACRNSILLSFEQLSVIIALFAYVASKLAAPAQGGMS